MVSTDSESVASVEEEVAEQRESPHKSKTFLFYCAIVFLKGVEGVGSTVDYTFAPIVHLRKYGA